MSPSSKSQFNRRASVSAMVVLPEPDTPITTRAHGILPVSAATKILRQRSLIHQPNGLAGGTRAAGRQVLAIQHARQDRALLRSHDREQHFAAGGERRQRPPCTR